MPYKKAASLAILLAALSGLYGATHSYLLKVIINILNSLPSSSAVYAMLILPIAAILIASELHQLAWRAISYINLKVTPNVKNNILVTTENYVLQHARSFFHDNPTGAIASKINALADSVIEISAMPTLFIIRGFVQFSVALIAMYFVYPIFSLCLLIGVILFITISVIFAKGIRTYSDIYAEKNANAQGVVVDTIVNANSVRGFSNRSYELKFLSNFLSELKVAHQKRDWYKLKYNTCQGLSVSALLMAVFSVMMYLGAHDKFSVGDFAFIVTLIFYIVDNIWWLTEISDNINKHIGICRRTLNTIFVPFDISDDGKVKLTYRNRPSIAFNDVTFGYNQNTMVFKHLNITINKNQKIGLVGYSGTRKSTFVHLILRLYEVLTGNITIDGIDIKHINQNELNSLINMITQDPSMFHRSIRDNIKYGKIDASDDEIIAAAKRAYAHDFIIRLPHGYDTLVEDRGTKLSGGQSQRIAIARAILKDSPIIIDEGNSSLDSLTEKYIQESLTDLMQNKTAIVIAHRLSTLRQIDRILVFNNGMVVEDGTHSDLVNKGGIYQKLWEAQSNGFLGTADIYNAHTDKAECV